VIASAASPQDSTWNTKTSELHHWETLGALNSGLTDDPAANLDWFEERIDHARGLYTRLRSDGVVFDRNSADDHLLQWWRAMKALRRLVGI